MRPLEVDGLKVLRPASTPPGQHDDADALEIRPVRSDDKPDLVDGFAQLGDESRYQRFMSARDLLSDAELRYFTEVDHHDHEALIAIDPRTGRGVGVARFIRSPVEPRIAELAVTVVDEWQGRRVGTRLASELAGRAREEGITVLTALVLAENGAMLALARALGAVQVSRQEGGAVEIAIELSDQGAAAVTPPARGA